MLEVWGEGAQSSRVSERIKIGCIESRGVEGWRVGAVIQEVPKEIRRKNHRFQILGYDEEGEQEQDGDEI
eukprot:6004975-Karenia_brevis.AAC.1